MVFTGPRGALKFFLWLAALLSLQSLQSCKKEEVLPLNLYAIEAGGINLQSTHPTGVAVKAPISATFTTNVDPVSVSETSVRLTRDYDQADIPLTLIVSGPLLSIKPVADLNPGAFYTLLITSELKSSHGEPFASYTTTFKTVGLFVPSNQVAYWNFENTPPDDIVGTYDPLEADIVDIEYVSGRNDSSGIAASFNGITSVIQVANGAGLLRPEFSISLWMKLNSENHTDQHGNQKGNFVIGLGNSHGLYFEVHPDYAWCKFSHALLLEDNSTTMNDFQFFANGETYTTIRSNPDSLMAHGIENATVWNQDFGSVGIRQRLDNQWAHIVMTFEDSTKTRTLYINGEKMYQQDLSLLNNNFVLADLRPLSTATSMVFITDSDIPPHYDDKLVFGFWQSTQSTYGGEAGSYSSPDANHFKGLLDDIRIFSRALTEVEVSLMYEGEKP